MRPGGLSDVSDRLRVAEVWRIQARHQGRRSTSDRAYHAYLGVAIFGLYVVPVVIAFSRWLDQGGAAGGLVQQGGTGVYLAAGVLAMALVLGSFWGPIVAPPFVLHVLTASDVPRFVALRRIIGRRAVLVTVLVGVPVGALTYGLSSPVGPLGQPLLALSATAQGAFWAVTFLSLWVVGQAGSRARSFLAGSWVAVGLMTGAALLGATATESSGRLLLAFGARPESAAATTLGWVLMLVIAVLPAWIGFDAVRTVPSARLIRDAVRTTQAAAYTQSASFHDALDLFRPTPRGHTSKARSRDGLPRGHLTVGIVRAARTPYRSLVGLFLLVGGFGSGAVGSELVHLPGVAEAHTGVLVGAGIMLYLGSGWISENWRMMLQELSMVPLFGRQDGTTIGRSIQWPLCALAASSVVGVSIAGLASILAGGAVSPPSPQSLLVLGAVGATGFAARFTREMKQLLPVSLLTPIPTPFGDLSGLRVAAWQFDGVLLVVGITFVITSVPPVLIPPLTAAVVVGCGLIGLRRAQGPDDTASPPLTKMRTRLVRALSA